jgi:hypothetical protein
MGELMMERYEGNREAAIREAGQHIQAVVDAAMEGSPVQIGVDVKPDERNPKDLLGIKKAPLRLVPPALTIYTSIAMAVGGHKYGPYNWRSKKVLYTVYLEAALRHIADAIDGEDEDEESGGPPEAHIAACMAIILDARVTGNLIDDRPPKGAVKKALQDVADILKRKRYYADLPSYKDTPEERARKQAALDSRKRGTPTVSK